MKIYHKFLLYQNKLLKPYVRILLGLVEALTYLASLLLIVGVIYEHGFPLSVDEVAKIQVLYKAVWIIFLVDVTLHISLEYRSTKKQYRPVGLDFERFAVSDFDTGHFPSSGRRRGDPAILGVSGREVLSSCLINNFFFSEFVQRTGPFVGASH